MTDHRQHIAVVGAGRMGQGIALAFAYSGYPVSLVDLKPRSADELATLRAGAVQKITQDLHFLQQQDALPAGVDATLNRVSFISADTAESALLAADIIFEAIPETPEAKRSGLQAISRLASPQALVASTTSTFSADLLADMVSGPERFLNAHWLNPAHLMPLVEVSPNRRTTAVNVQKLLVTLRLIGKVPIVCASSPGYIVPRIQALAMNEAARMVEEGIASAEDIDTAVRVGFGIRFALLGLLEFIDWGGGDILYYASRNLAAGLGESRFKAPTIIEKNMHEGHRGLRDGRGFFDYADRDVDAYRNARLADFVTLLRQRNLMPVAATAVK